MKIRFRAPHLQFLVLWTLLSTGELLSHDALAAVQSEPGGRPKQEKQILVGCPNAWLSRREGSEYCWVRRIAGDHSLCLSRDLWNQLLASDAAFACGEWSGKWRTWAPLLNEYHSDARKSLSFSFSAKAFRHYLPPPRPWWGTFLSGIERARERLSNWFTPADPLGIARALVLTEKSAGNPSSLLREVGFVHLLTATGIHLYALAFWTSRVFLAASESLCRFGIPLGLTLRLARAATGFLWLWAWLLSGGRPGMFRPWIVIGLRALGKRAGIRWRKWAPLAIALAADLAVALLRTAAGLPGAWAPGRWLYALAVGGGMLTLDYSRGQSTAKQHWQLAVGSWVFVGLVEAALHHVAALATPFLSVITIPVFSIVIYPALLAGSLLDLWGMDRFAQLLAESAAWASNQVVILLFQIVAWIPTLWIISRWALVAGAASALLLVIFTSRRSGFWVAGAALMSGLLVRSFDFGFAANSELTAHPQFSRARAIAVEQLDVGQGDAALVRLERGAGLIDSGPRAALSDSAWIRLFAERDIDRLDWVFLTHYDEDHAGGLEKLQALMTVSRNAPPFPMLGPADTEARKLGLGRTKARSRNREMRSIFVPLARGGFFLSAGDSSAEDELWVGRWAGRLSASEGRNAPRILKVSHHGSRFSTSDEFLRLVQPTDAWISSGVGNRFGHPTAVVLKRLSHAGIRIQRTDLDGSLLKEAGVRRRSP